MKKIIGLSITIVFLTIVVLTIIVLTSSATVNSSTTLSPTKDKSIPSWDAPYLSPKTEVNSLSESLRSYGALADILRINIVLMKAQLREKLDEDPSDSIACIILGDILTEQGILQLALTYFDSAVTLAPSYPAAHLALGRALYKLNDLEAAIAQFDTTIALDSLNAIGWSMRAIANSMNDNWSAAQKDFERSNAIKELSHEERYRYGICFWATGDLERAVIEFENSIQGQRSDYRIYVSWGMAEASRGNLDEARQGLAHALELHKPDERLYEALADINALDNRTDSTQYYLELAVKLAPFQTRLRNRLGAIYSHQKNFADAEEMFKISASLESENATTFAEWARAKALQGDFQAASLLIDKALRLDPRNENIRKIREKILPGMPILETH